jgi:hypothetical protein
MFLGALLFYIQQVSKHTSRSRGRLQMSLLGVSGIEPSTFTFLAACRCKLEIEHQTIYYV